MFTSGWWVVSSHAQYCNGGGKRTAWQEEHVLEEGREHVPGLEMHERPDEVETVGRSQRYDNVTECRIGLDQAILHNISAFLYTTELQVHLLRQVLPASDGMRHSEVHRVASTPERKDVTKTKQHHAERVNPLRTLRTVAERTHDDDEDKGDVQLPADASVYTDGTEHS